MQVDFDGGAFDAQDAVSDGSTARGGVDFGLEGCGVDDPDVGAPQSRSWRIFSLTRIGRSSGERISIQTNGGWTKIRSLGKGRKTTDTSGIMYLSLRI